jgi:catechol 2,3-dioxygenase-like lactoylglutathione lyase family enzyme
MSTKPRFAFVLEYVADVEAAKPFYQEILGLTVEREHPTFIQFKDAAGVAFAISSDTPLGNGAPEVCWVVDDAEAAYRTLSEKVDISLPLVEQPFGKIFGVRDPAGQPQYLVEFARNRPSRLRDQGAAR